MAFKTFTAGAALTASDVNTYLMKQTVIVCTAATRPSAVDGMMIYETDTDRLLVSPDGATWVRVGWNSSTGRTWCNVRRAAVLSIPNNSATNITWDTEDADADAFIAVSSTTLTVPTGLGGLYSITLKVAWASFPTSGWIGITAGGHDLRLAVGDAQSGCGWTIDLAATNTIVATAYQNSGAAINITGELWAVRVGA